MTIEERITAILLGEIPASIEDADEVTAYETRLEAVQANRSLAHARRDATLGTASQFFTEAVDRLPGNYDLLRAIHDAIVEEAEADYDRYLEEHPLPADPH